MEILGIIFFFFIVVAGIFFLMGCATMGSASEAWRIIKKDFFNK